MARGSDGSAGDADYGRIGTGYAQYRKPDRRIEALIARALGDARTVLNVGARLTPMGARPRESAQEIA